MAGPIYKFFQTRYTERWYQLSEAEQNAHLAKVEQALKKLHLLAPADEFHGGGVRRDTPPDEAMPASIVRHRR